MSETLVSGRLAAEHERAVGADAGAGVVGVVEVAAVDAPGRRRLPVGAEDLFAAVDLDGDLRLVVVAGAAGVRLRVGVQNGHARRVQAVLPGCGRARRRPGSSRWCWPRCRAGRSGSRGSGCSRLLLLSTRLREVTLALELGRHLDAVRVGRRREPALVLEGEEEEQPVACPCCSRRAAPGHRR